MGHARIAGELHVSRTMVAGAASRGVGGVYAACVVAVGRAAGFSGLARAPIAGLEHVTRSMMVSRTCVCVLSS